MDKKRLYFTFGTDSQFDFGIDDYVLVIGADKSDCIKAFQKKHPNRPDSECINCADYYGPEEWEKQIKKYYEGKKPAEIIISDNAYGLKPKGYSPIWFFVPSQSVLIFLQEGSGDSLEPEDREEGNVDYVDYTVYDLEINGEIGQGEGGMMMLPYHIRKHYECLADAIPDVLGYEYENMFHSAQILYVPDFS